MNKSRLIARVEARNIANRTMRQVSVLMLEALRPLVGTKIKCTTGARTVKLEKAISSVLDTNLGIHPSARLWVNTDRYAFRLSVSVSRPVEGESGCVSEEATFYLGDMDGGAVLTALSNIPPDAAYPTDFHADTILAARDAVKDARAALNDAERGLCGFGEYDR